MRVCIVLAIGVFVAACEPSGAPIDAGRRCPEDLTVFIDAPALAGAGFVSIEVAPSSEDSLATLSAQIVDADGGVVQTFSPSPFTGTRYSFPVTPGRYTIETEARCGATRTQNDSFTFDVRPVLELTQTIPRGCALLTRMGSDRFDCDGVVIDRAGAPVADWLEADRSRVVVTDAGVFRWALVGTTISLQRDAVSLGSADFSLRAPFIASQDFVFGNGQMVIVGDGGLTSLTVDAGGFEGDEAVPCAAASAGTRRRISWCLQPVAVFEYPTLGAPIRTCDVAIDTGTVSQCSDRHGLFVRQDLETRRVLLQDNQRFYSFDLFEPQIDRSERRSNSDEHATFFNAERAGDGTQAGLFVFGSTARGVLGREPDFLSFFLTTPALSSSQLVWRAFDGGTQFDDLP